MNTNINRLLAICGIIALQPGALLADFQHTTGSNENYYVQVSVPCCAHYHQHGTAYGDTTNYIRGYGPLGGFDMPAPQYLELSGEIAANTYDVYQEVGGEGYICVDVTWDEPGPPAYGDDATFLLGYGYNKTRIARGRPELEVVLNSRTGWPIDANVKRLLDDGCIGLAKIALRARLPSGNYTYPAWRSFPELETDPKFGSIHAFLTLEAANAYPGCGSGTHEVLFVKYGKWKNGSAPTPAADGTIPVDSVVSRDPELPNFDYKVLINGKWLGINHAKTDEVTDPQELWEYDTAPGANNPTIGRMILKRCVPD